MILVVVLIISVIVGTVHLADSRIRNDIRKEIINGGLVTHTVVEGESWAKYVKDIRTEYGDQEALGKQLQNINLSQKEKGYTSTDILFPGDKVLVPASYEGAAGD